MRKSTGLVKLVAGHIESRKVDVEAAWEGADQEVDGQDDEDDDDEAGSEENDDDGDEMEDDESEALLRGYVSGELYKRGLICRADDRGDPVIQLAPPLIADTEQFEEIHDVLRGVLTDAWERVQSRAGTAGWSPRRG